MKLFNLVDASFNGFLHICTLLQIGPLTIQKSNKKILQSYLAKCMYTLKTL